MHSNTDTITPLSTEQRFVVEMRPATDTCVETALIVDTASGLVHAMIRPGNLPADWAPCTLAEFAQSEANALNRGQFLLFAQDAWELPDEAPATDDAMSVAELVDCFDTFDYDEHLGYVDESAGLTVDAIRDTFDAIMGEVAR